MIQFVLFFSQPSYPTTTTTLKTTGNIKKSPHPSTYNFPPSSWPVYNSYNGTNFPPSFQAFDPQQQQQYPPPYTMYQPQIPFQMPAPWPSTTYNRPAVPVVYNNNTHVESRRGSKHRARSVETSYRVHPPGGYDNQQEQD